MKQRKHLANWNFFVDAVSSNRVFLRAIRADQNDATEEEMEFPLKRFIRMFGKEHLKEGMFGRLCCYSDAQGRVKLRGWPFKRKWTKEEFDAADSWVKALQLKFE